MTSPVGSMSPRERIEHLVRSGSIDAAEADRLRAAIGSAPSRSWLRLVTHPFERLSGELTSGLGLVVAALSVGVARSGIRFDGALDVHVAAQAVPLRVALLDQAVAWLLPALLFWAYARALAPGRRLRDFVGVVGLSRVPLLLLSPLLVALSPPLPIDPTHPPLKLLAVAVVSLAFVAAFITLLYRGFANASGLRGGARLIGGFVAVLFVAEVVSKIVLALLA